MPVRRRTTRASSLACAVGAAALACLGAGCGGALPTAEVFRPPAASFASVSRYTAAGSGSAPVKLHSEEAGQGPPLILLHGFGASTYTWRHVHAELARTHQAIALDMKGFGRSDKPLDEAYSALDQARLVKDFIVRRKLRRVTLVGHSYGGAVALALALELERMRPRRLDRLVLIDAAAYSQGLPPALHVLRTPYLGPLSAAVIPPTVQSTAALALAYADPSRIKAEDIEAYARPMSEPGNRHALVKTAEQIIPEHVNILTHQYRTLTRPALLIWCRNDKIVPLSNGEKLARELPKARLEVIETCGHVPHEEEPARTLELMRGFLAGRM
jgi:pimeloyl-ACP methyl ester carboxylesterase